MYLLIFLVIKRKKQIAYSLGALCSVLSVEDNFAMDCLCLRASLPTVFHIWVLIKWAFFKASFPTFYPFGKITPLLRFESFSYGFDLELSRHREHSDVPVAGSGI